MFYEIIKHGIKNPYFTVRYRWERHGFDEYLTESQLEIGRSKLYSPIAIFASQQEAKKKFEEWAREKIAEEEEMKHEEVVEKGKI